MDTIPEEEYASLKTDIAHLIQQVQYLLDQTKLGKYRQFGASSSKSEYDLD